MPTRNKTKAKAQSRERMRRMRERRAAAKVSEVRGIVLPSDLAEKAELAALFTNSGSVHDLVTLATQVYVEKTEDDTVALYRVICARWPQIRAYLPYMKWFKAPCPPMVFGGVTFTYENAVKLSDIFADIKRHMWARGVTLQDEALMRLLDRICQFNSNRKPLPSKPLARGSKTPEIPPRA